MAHLKAGQPVFHIEQPLGPPYRIRQTYERNDGLHADIKNREGDFAMNNVHESWLEPMRLDLPKAQKRALFSIVKG